jgi:hypothetical protein
LVIQHHFHRKNTPRKSPPTNDSKAVVTPRPPPPPETTTSNSNGFGHFRVVTQEISRVLQVQATTTSSKLQADIMKDLSQKVQEETKQIFFINKAKRVASLQAKKEAANCKKFHKFLTQQNTEQLQAAFACNVLITSSENDKKKKKTKKKRKQPKNNHTFDGFFPNV